jgi:phosphoglycolate phosphatase
MDELLGELKRAGVPWGIVTNKAARFTEVLVRELSLAPDCVVCGDSTPHLKPHPAPMLLAGKKLNIPLENCLYLGDDLRDIQAARAAGMRPVAVEWGYVSPDNDGPASWNADALISHPREVMQLLQAAN